MHLRAHDSNHGTVTTASTPTRRLYRRPDRGIAGGVATGIAEHLGLSNRLVRWAFVALAVAGGVGGGLFGAYLIVLPTPPGSRRRRVGRCPLRRLPDRAADRAGFRSRPLPAVARVHGGRRRRGRRGRHGRVLGAAGRALRPRPVRLP